MKTMKLTQPMRLTQPEKDQLNRTEQALIDIQKLFNRILAQCVEIRDVLNQSETNRLCPPAKARQTTARLS